MSVCEGEGRMPSWNFADLWEECAALRGEAPAAVHGDRTFSWADFDRRADGVAAALLDAGLARQDKVAQYLYNGPEYMQGVYACFKAGLVPVNTNYRYADDELVYLWDNADAAAVMFHGSFVPTVERIRPRLPGVKLWLWADDGTHPRPAWAADLEEAAGAPVAGPVRPPWGRSGQDLWLLYTGGTTGMPKGVMWEQDTLARLVSEAHPLKLGDDTPRSAYRDQISGLAGAGASPVLLPAAPLMHGTGHMTSLSQLTLGGCVVTLPGRSLDPEAIWQACAGNGVTVLVIVGDAFARPLVEALDAEPGRWDLARLGLMVSSGVMWSQPVKERLLDHLPQVTIFDSLGSSEAVGMANSFSSKGNVQGTASFALGASAVVITDDGRRVAPGSGEIGRLGVGGLLPVGYYKDEAKTAATFPVIDGVRYSLPGDWATVEADGSVTLLGRGSVCINTGGEKVFPEEVEEVLKTADGVVDAVCVGVPDERFGEAICAIVEPRPGGEVDPDAVVAHVKAHLAHYKAPRLVLVRDAIGRAPNGKVDYKALTAWAREQQGAGHALP
ncbi:MAG TPA: AMP-binding protein [Acidimicrobiales bacterium]|nr:AMP-binding protein [Acidimicrobiales bacterium]